MYVYKNCLEIYKVLYKYKVLASLLKIIWYSLLGTWISNNYGIVKSLLLWRIILASKLTSRNKPYNPLSRLHSHLKAEMGLMYNRARKS